MTSTAELARFSNTRQLEASELYRQLKPHIDRLLQSVVHENFASASTVCSDEIRAAAWNIERGMRTEAVIRAIVEHPRLAAADVYLLSELDRGMARTGNRFVARDIAERLNLNYAFAPCYLALNKGSGAEKQVEGANEESLHGNALLSPHPMYAIHSVALPNGKDKMKGAEKRIGCQRAVVADIAHPAGAFRAVSLHLDAHSSQRHRQRQMRLVLDHLDGLTPQIPVLIGGDWNTTTHDASRALYSILGYGRRVLMGVRHVVSRHYPYPERWFERGLFRELEARGYNLRGTNVPGLCTLHYGIDDLAANLNMAEWVPHWCFWFINWALKRTGGRCSMKLDWYASKEMTPSEPGVLQNLMDSGSRISDHDPIVLNVKLENPRVSNVTDPV